jgi:hypothetical protein
MVMLTEAGDAIMTAYWEDVAPSAPPVVLVSVVSAVIVNAPAIDASR